MRFIVLLGRKWFFLDFRFRCVVKVKSLFSMFLLGIYLVFVTPVSAISLHDTFTLMDTMSESLIGEGSNHTIVFGTIAGLTTTGKTITISLEQGKFDLSEITLSDIDLTDNVEEKTLGATAGDGIWGVAIATDTIIFTTPTTGTGYIEPITEITIKIGTNATSGGTGTKQILNPANAGSYLVDLEIQNTQQENGMIAVAIIDGSQIVVTGTNVAYINFDIDTGTGDGLAPAVNCDFDTCLVHSGGAAGNNYTLDFGELTYLWVNKSNADSVNHSDGLSGIVNSIYFDLTTNAEGGAVVSVISTNAGLQGPEANIIQSLGVGGGADGDNITTNSGKYGFTLQETPSTLIGTVNRNTFCDSIDNYCGFTLSSKEVFNTNNSQIEDARIRMDIAAAATYINTPGSYTDALRFIVTSTY